MRLYSDGNPNAFVNGYVKDVVPVYEHSEGEDPPIFVGFRLTFSDGRTEAMIDVAEADMIWYAVQHK